jgi:hypothetical protein
MGWKLKALQRLAGNLRRKGQLNARIASPILEIA